MNKEPEYQQLCRFEINYKSVDTIIDELTKIKEHYKQKFGYTNLILEAELDDPLLYYIHGIKNKVG